MIRHSVRLLLPRGRFSSMMELGGTSAPETAKRLDMGKNNKVRAIALDFDLITRSIEAQKAKGDEATTTKLTVPTTPSVHHSSTIKPDVGMVEKIADLLNVQLGGETGSKKEDNDDLSRLTGERPSMASSSFESLQPTNVRSKGDSEIGSSILDVVANNKARGGSKKDRAVSTKAPPFTDVRAKYADKLRHKLDGGLAGVDRAKAEREDFVKKGDAAGHLAARRVASAQAVPSGSKWLATTGAANLLQYLTSRSVQVALLPVPDNDDAETNKLAGDRMEELTRQLPQVSFHLLVKDGDRSRDEILAHVSDEVDVPPLGTLVVSDRDDYLKTAKERGMFTCRVRPMNAPRGNVSTSYTVATVGEVEDVVNELNGISYNTVFAGAGINYGGV